MSAKFQRCVDIVLKHEGGFTEGRGDPGGTTNYGISLRYARGQGSLFDLDGDGDVDRDDILLVTPEKASIAYRDWFWRDVRGDELPPGVDLAIFDFAVNSGASRAIRETQMALGLQVDGVLGPVTMAAIKATEPGTLIALICRRRLAFLKRLSHWSRFGVGWERRVNDIETKALNMVGLPSTTAREAVQTGTVQGAGVAATVATVATVASQAEPVIQVLGGLAPWLAALIIGAALIGIVVWRMKK